MARLLVIFSHDDDGLPKTMAALDRWLSEAGRLWRMVPNVSG